MPVEEKLDGVTFTSCRSVDEDEDEWLLLLAALMGCFVEHLDINPEECPPGIRSRAIRRRGGDFPFEYSTNIVKTSPPCSFKGVRKALRYLIYERDAIKARRELEHIIDVHAERYLRKIHSSQPHSGDGDGEKNENVECCEMAQILHEITGMRLPHTSPTTTTITTVMYDVIVPAELLYIVYYLACIQSPSFSSSREATWDSSSAACSPWVKLFYGPFFFSTNVSGSNDRACMHTSHCSSSSSECGGGDGKRYELNKSSKKPEDLRSSFSQLLLRYMTRHEMTCILSCIDAYQSWLMQDYRTVLKYAEEFFHILPLQRGKEKSTITITRTVQLCVQWVMRYTLYFVHASSLVSITNMSNPKARRVAMQRLQFDVTEHLHEDEYGNCMRTLFSCSYFAHTVYDMIISELSFPENMEPHNEKRGKGYAVFPRSSWQHVFLLSLQIWLRAKRHTEEGEMMACRDIVLHTLEGLNDPTCRRHGESHELVKSLFHALSSSSCHASSVGSSIEGERIHSSKHVKMYLLSSLWLRQLFLINCSALADTCTLFYFTHHMRQQLTLSEVMYLMISPTISSGGIHSSLFDVFPSDMIMMRMAEEDIQNTSKEKIMSFPAHMPLPIRVPLISHQVWKLRQNVLHALQEKEKKNVSYEESHVFLQKKLLHLCEIVVKCICGLCGSLELCFTDCAPHRVLFDAIIIACDVQENILRYTTATTPSCFSSSLHSSSYENCSGGNMGEEESIHAMETSGGNVMFASVFDSVCVENSSSVSFTVDNEEEQEVKEEEDEGDSENWLVRNSLSPSLSLLSESHARKSTPSVSFTSVTMEELYWYASRKAHEWIKNLEDHFPHLPCLVEICKLRVAAAAFDRKTAYYSRCLLHTYKGNPLVMFHVSLSLFSNLHVVSAERCIQETLQQYPHSMELQRLYHSICDHNTFNGYGCDSNKEEEEVVTRAKDDKKRKRTVKPMFTYRYRAIFPVKCITSKPDGVISMYTPILLSFICILLFLAFFLLHVRDVRCKENVIPRERNDMMFHWSFVLSSTLPVYWGFGIILYTCIAALIAPFLLELTEKRKHKKSVAMFLHALMEWNHIITTDIPNHFVFCIRGLPLINLLLWIQLIVLNTYKLEMYKEASCIRNSEKSNNNIDLAATSSGGGEDVCHYMYIKWGIIEIIMTILFLIISVLFHGRCWRVIRYRDCILGSFSTFLTIFFIDIFFFIFLSPFLFLSSLFLEPFFFFVDMLFSHVLSSSSSLGPLLVKHFSSIPRDDEMLRTTPTHTALNNNSISPSIPLFVEHASSHICEKLHESMPPRHWLPSRRHDCRVLCFHELTAPSTAHINDDSGNSNNNHNNHVCTLLSMGRILRLLRRLASKGISTCACIHDVIHWHVHRAPEKSESAVQLALLHESFNAVVVPASLLSGGCFSLEDTLFDEGEAGDDADKWVTPLATTSHQWEVSSTTPYG